MENAILSPITETTAGSADRCLLHREDDMISKRLGLVVAMAFWSVTMAVCAQEDPVSKLDWQIGPTTGMIGDKATIRVPEGYAFLGNVDQEIDGNDGEYSKRQRARVCSIAFGMVRRVRV